MKYYTSTDDIIKAFNDTVKIFLEAISNECKNTETVEAFITSSGEFIRNSNGLMDHSDRANNAYTKTMVNSVEQMREKILSMATDDNIINHRLQKFLVEAKLHGYGSATPPKDEFGKRTIKYTNETYPEFTYIDEYVGGEMFSGREVIMLDKTKPIYSLSYAGIEYKPFDEDRAIFDCLAKALTLGPKNNPDNLRGEHVTYDEDGKYVYLVNYHYNGKGYVSGTEFIITIEEHRKLVNRATSEGLHDVDLLIKLMEECEANNTHPDYIVFRCDFQGGLVK
jgi:hypothetical protein